jgi:hypothetical protein
MGKSDRRFFVGAYDVYVLDLTLAVKTLRKRR